MRLDASGYRESLDWLRGNAWAIVEDPLVIDAASFCEAKGLEGGVRRTD